MAPKAGYQLAVILIVLFLTGAGCSNLPSTKPYLAKERNSRWVNDLAYLQETLPRVHKNLYFRVSAEEFNRQLAELKKKVPQYTDEEIEIALSVILAGLGDTHTGSNIGGEFQYPLELHWFAEGIYIAGTAQEYQYLLDAKIIALNGIKSEEVANTLRPLLAGANDSWFKTQIVYYLPIPGVLKYFGLSNGDEIELEVELASGQVEKVQLEPMSYREYVPAERPERTVPLYRSRPNENYWYEYLSESKILYFNYRSCRQMRNKPFEVFRRELWTLLKSHNIRKLVLDIRENRGGSSIILDPLIKELKKSSFNQEGKLYVIIGKDTFSSAILNAIRLKKETAAYFVGEATGGEPNHYGEVKQFQLPNSKKAIRYSTKYFRWFDQELNTLKPDKEIEESFAAYRGGTDPVLKWIEPHGVGRIKLG
jgi:hypothetical protein